MTNADKYREMIKAYYSQHDELALKLAKELFWTNLAKPKMRDVHHVLEALEKENKSKVLKQSTDK